MKFDVHIKQQFQKIKGSKLISSVYGILFENISAWVSRQVDLVILNMIWSVLYWTVSLCYSPDCFILYIQYLPIIHIQRDLCRHSKYSCLLSRLMTYLRSKRMSYCGGLRLHCIIICHIWHRARCLQKTAVKWRACALLICHCFPEQIRTTEARQTSDEDISFVGNAHIRSHFFIVGDCG